MKGIYKLILKNGNTKTFYYYGNAINAFFEEYGLQDFRTIEEKIIIVK